MIFGVTFRFDVKIQTAIVIYSKLGLKIFTG